MSMLISCITVTCHDAVQICSETDKYGALAVILLLPFASYLRVTGPDIIEIPDSHTAT